MSDMAKLPTCTSLEELPALRAALSQELFGAKPRQEFSVEVSGDVDVGSLAAIDSTSGTLHVDKALNTLTTEGIDALAHALVHTLGEGPAFPLVTDQLLEEALTEIIADAIAPDLAICFGWSFTRDPLLREIEGNVYTGHPCACAVSVERFAQLCRAIQGATVDSALHVALELKDVPGDQRFDLLAAKLMPEDAKPAACSMLARWLRGYMHEIVRSRTGLAGVFAAVETAMGKSTSIAPMVDNVETVPARQELAKAEEVILKMRSTPQQITAALLEVTNRDVWAALCRSLDMRQLVWSALLA